MARPARCVYINVGYQIPLFHHWSTANNHFIARILPIARSTVAIWVIGATLTASLNLRQTCHETQRRLTLWQSVGNGSRDDAENAKICSQGSHEHYLGYIATGPQSVAVVRGNEARGTNISITVWPRTNLTQTSWLTSTKPALYLQHVKSTP